MTNLDLITFRKNQEILDEVIKRYYNECLRHSEDYEDYIGWTWYDNSEIIIHYIQLDYRNEWINEEYYVSISRIAEYAMDNEYEFEPIGMFNIK